MALDPHKFFFRPILLYRLIKLKLRKSLANTFFIHLLLLVLIPFIKGLILLPRWHFWQLWKRLWLLSFVNAIIIKLSSRLGLLFHIRFISLCSEHSWVQLIAHCEWFFYVFKAVLGLGVLLDAFWWFLRWFWLFR